MDYPSFDLDGKVALVTGASRGIGHDLVLALAHAGARVVPAARRVEDLDALVRRVEEEGGEALPVPLDVRDLASIEGAFERAIEGFGGVDVLVNNAGSARTTTRSASPRRSGTSSWTSTSRGSSSPAGRRGGA